MRRLQTIIHVLTCVFLLATADRQAMSQARADDADHAFAQATRLHESGDIEGAIRGYLAILKTRPERTDVRSNLGAAYARLGRYEEAIEQYRRARARDSRNQTIRFNLALAYYKAAWFAEAAGELALLAAAQPENMNAALLLADCHLRLGEHKKVIALLSPLEARQRDNRLFAYLLGSALIGDNQLEQGQALIDRFFRGEDSAEAHVLIGAALLPGEDSKSALKEFERALQLNPKLPTARSWYGRVLLRAGETEKAKEAFQGELEINPNDFEANLYLGMLLRKDGNLDGALSYLRRAAQIRPKDLHVRYFTGAIFMATGKIAEAQQLLEGVVKELPDFVEAHVLLARAYYRLNRKEDGDREQAIVQKLNDERQAQQLGAQEGAAYRGQKLPEKPLASKPPVKQP